jgi:hypothetical protein
MPIRLNIIASAMVLCTALIFTSVVSAQQSVGEPSGLSPAEQFRQRHPYIDISDFVRKMAADRRLLSEVRKEVPESRDEAEMYLARLKKLAAEADPVRLAPLMDRVLSQASIYFEWLEGEFESEEDRVAEYYLGGAQGFYFAIENFKSAVLMNVINRLEIAGRLVQELDPDLLQ